MGYAGKLEEKLKAQRLRKQGFSYKEILQTISVSKDTISRWCKDIELSAEQKECLLQNKFAGQKKGSIVAAENKRKARLVRIQIITQESLEDLGDLVERDIFISGIALYAAEGDKTDGKGGFSNSDPKLIKFMTKWFLEFAKVPKEQLRGVIYLHDNLDENKAKLFWSKITNIPLSQFRKTYIVKQTKKNTRFKKRIHEYGVFSIRFSNSHIHRKIMGWISAMFDARISLHSAIAQR